jgi:hypothetical protein
VPMGRKLGRQRREERPHPAKAASSDNSLAKVNLADQFLNKK